MNKSQDRRRNVRGKRNWKWGMARVSDIAHTLQYLLGRLNEEMFPEHGRHKHKRKKNQMDKIC